MKLKNLTALFSRAAMTLLLMLLTTTGAWSIVSTDGWSYYKNYTGTECYIDGYSGSKDMTTLTIPSTLDGATVLGISGIDFSEFTNLETIEFESISAITTMFSLKGCSKLKHINDKDTRQFDSHDVLPLSVTTINSETFKGTAIQELGFINVTSIGSNAFEGLPLKSVVIAKDATIGTDAFANISTDCDISYYGPITKWNPFKYEYSPNLVVVGTNQGPYEDWYCGWCGGKKSEDKNYLYWEMNHEGILIIKPSRDAWETYPSQQLITSRKWNDYNHITAVSTLVLEHVYALGAEEFKDLTSLSSVTLNSDLTSIGASAFEGCTSLTSITIPASVKSIGANAFKDCENLTSVIIEGNPAIGADAFPDGATVTMTQTANGPVDGKYWMTFYNDGGNFRADANTTVYKAKINGSSLVLTSVSDKIVTAGKAVILKSSSQHPVMTMTSSVSSDGYAEGSNDLQGVMTETDKPANCYTLANGSSGVGFYPYNGAKIHIGKAYLIYPSNSARQFISFSDDATAIEAPAIVSDGEDGEVYDLMGRRVEGQPARGINVKQGKKFIVK